MHLHITEHPTNTEFRVRCILAIGRELSDTCQIAARWDFMNICQENEAEINNTMQSSSQWWIRLLWFGARRLRHWKRWSHKFRSTLSWLQPSTYMPSTLSTRTRDRVEDQEHLAQGSRSWGSSIKEGTTHAKLTPKTRKRRRTYWGSNYHNSKKIIGDANTIGPTQILRNGC